MNWRVLVQRGGKSPRASGSESPSPVAPGSALDAFFERRTRALASATSRRHALVRMGRLLVGAAFLLPVLPFDRSGGLARAAGGHGGAGKGTADDESSCDYWRHCAVDGFLCSCCGGSITTCAPGTEPSKVTWIGTCRNPKDGRDYLISYNDCCGRSSCGRCFCNTNLSERPAYRMGVHNDVNWCMGNDSSVYYCTVALAVGIAEPARK